MLLSSLPAQTDILVIGSGAAGLTAALQARLSSSSPSVLLLDACPEEWAGGNSYFTAGAYRTCHGGLQDLAEIVSNLKRGEKDPHAGVSRVDSGIHKSEESANDEKPSSNDTAPISLIDLAPYTAVDFHDDMRRVTSRRCDSALTATLIKSSREVVQWLYEVGKVDWQLSFRRQAYRLDGRYQFWGGLALTVNGGGKGLVSGLLDRVRESGVDLCWECRCVGLLMDSSSQTVVAARIQPPFQGKEIHVQAKAVILCAGGFEASPSLRSQYLGSNWASAHVRGTPFNDGSVLSIALRDCAAVPTGDWAGCHAVAWDADAPSDRGDRSITNEFTKSGYPLGIMVNVRGQRFVDEGVDLRNFTYAKFGRAILEQAHGEVFQIWDAKTLRLLRDEEYRPERTHRITASSLESLAEQMALKGLEDPEAFLATVKDFNDAVTVAELNGDRKEKVFNPAIKDGLGTLGLALPKSNWALRIDEAPVVAVKVGSGITFTFGGLKIDPESAAVVTKRDNGQEEIIPNLFCAGEMVGGLFWGNYPGGSGLTSGAVFGRRAAIGAVKWADG